MLRHVYHAWIVRVMTRLQNPGPDKPLPTAPETPQPWHALAIEVCGNAFSGKSALCQARPVEPMAWPLNLCTDEGLGAKRSIVNIMNECPYMRLRENPKSNPASQTEWP